MSGKSAVVKAIGGGTCKWRYLCLTDCFGLRSISNVETKYDCYKMLFHFAMTSSVLLALQRHERLQIVLADVERSFRPYVLSDPSFSPVVLTSESKPGGP